MQLKALQARILKIAKEEPYMGEKIPLKWLKFEEAKGSSQEPMMKMSQVTTPFLSKQYNKRKATTNRLKQNWKVGEVFVET